MLGSIGACHHLRRMIQSPFDPLSFQLPLGDDILCMLRETNIHR
jgi:hypothetical protein